MIEPPATHLELIRDVTAPKSMGKYTCRAVLVVVLSGVLARYLSLYLHGDENPAQRDLATEVLITVGLSAFALLVVVALPVRRLWLSVADAIGHHERTLTERSRAEAFLGEVQTAFDMAHDEDELVSSMERVLAQSSPGEVKVLISKRGERPRPNKAEGGCDTSSPHRCPAIRRGRTLVFDDVTHFSACPRLHDQEFASDAVATCVPVNVMGAPSAVVRSVIERSDLSAEQLGEVQRRIEGATGRFGNRLGMLRAIASTTLQANTDPLTGLLNRRALENAVGALFESRLPFTVAMADLDFFKQLNDTHGHDTGDRALRLFAQVAERALRGDDLVCRHGGEEFVFVLPGASEEIAEAAMNRIRDDLRKRVATTNLPPFTVSIGLADSSRCVDWSDLLHAADRALLVAKATGRDRVVVDRQGDDETPALTAATGDTDVAPLASVDDDADADLVDDECPAA